MTHNRLTSIQKVRSDLLVNIERSAEAAVYWSPGPPLWSSAEIMHHLAVSEEHFMAEVAGAAGMPVHSSVSSAVGDSDQSLAVETLLASLAKVRSKTEELLQSFDSNTWQARLAHSSHPLLVGRTVAEAVDFMAWHEARHVSQIIDLLSQYEKANSRAISS